MRNSLRYLILVGFPLLVWAAVAKVTPSYLVPAPVNVAKVLYEQYPIFAVDIAITFLEALGGLLLGTAAGVLFGTIFHFWRSIENAGMAYAVAMKSIPVVAIAPLMVVWFGNGMISKVILAALICFFPMLVGFRDGLSKLPNDLQQLTTVWPTKKTRKFLLLEVPFCIPYVLSALKVAAPLSVVGAVVAEFSGSDKGIGHSIIVAAYRADTTSLFAGIILVSLIGIGFYALSRSLENSLLQTLRMKEVGHG